MCLCCATAECVQRSCSDLRSAERLTTSANIPCERNIVVPRRQSYAVAAAVATTSWSPVAVVEILPSWSPSDHAGPPWTDSAVRRSKDATSSVVRGARSEQTPTNGGDQLHRKYRRRRSAASSTVRDVDAESLSTVNSADNVVGGRCHPPAPLDNNDDGTDARMTSSVSSPPASRYC